VVYLKDRALSTSGGYERFWDIGGKKYCHIIDPKSGRPVEGIWSASAIAASGAESDALSTAFFVMGKDKANSLCDAQPGTEAVFVEEGGHK
jgi:thiamine biosynthesis lipoprotein